ncbi:MAG: hypothetical protein LBR09_00950 [Endomicrobium sp.]|jgi:hypothetical protein|nr:hypothetical protein [Endomicrobium sp.]
MTLKNVGLKLNTETAVKNDAENMRKIMPVNKMLKAVAERKNADNVPR